MDTPKSYTPFVATMLLQTAVLLSVLVLATSYSCPNRLYRGQRLYVSQFLCSRNQNYRLLFNNTGQVQINEAFLSNTSFKPIPLTLFSTDTISPSPSYVTVTDAGDFVAVRTDGTVYWQANVSGAEFLELQDTGIAVLFAKNASTVRVLWKSLSTYSLRIVGGTNQTVGRLEIYFNNTWGSVSTSGSSNNFSADVACRTLGFDTGVMTTNTFGQSTGPVWMDQMNCSGRETVFQECSFGYWFSTRNWWGQVASTSHTNDAAISCQGSSSLGVLPPTAHVCTERLYVGQTLALGESLCAGPNGEYTLRFSNKRTDTVIELWYKTERKWSIGMTNAMPLGAAVRLDGDGVMRIVNATAVLFNLFSNTTANASFVELQDNGVVRVVSANGSTGWRKAPDDICYTERRKLRYYDASKYITSYPKSPLACLASCDSQTTCKTIHYNEFILQCFLLNGYPWDPSTNGTYLEKIAGCSSGAGCYQNYSYDRGSNEPYISFSSSTASASDCTSLCDSTATCISGFYIPSTTTCYLNWKRLNETVDNTFWTSYIRKVPCTLVDPSQVPLLPVKECPTQLLPGSFLLSQQYLCSPNGQHVLTVEKDGRLLIDGGKWKSNNASSLPGSLQYTTTNQLLFRLDDGSTPWKVDAAGSMTCTPPGFLALSNGGILQMVDSIGNVVWDHQNESHVYSPIIAGVLSPATAQLFDISNATCVSRVRQAKLRLSYATLNSTWDVVMIGHNLQCGNAQDWAAYSLAVAYEKLTQESDMYKMYACSLLTTAPLQCRFRCVCQSSYCEVLSLLYNGCGEPQGDICELI